MASQSLSRSNEVRLRATSCPALARLLKLLFVLLPWACVALGADTLSVGLGVDYSTGDYGESMATDILFIPAFLKWEKDPWTLKLSVSQVRMRGPGRVVLNGEKPITADEGTRAVTTQSGMGDTVLAIGRTLWAGAGGRAGLDVTGKVKFPTADESKGLGTGKFDSGLLADLYGSLGKSALFAGVGHRWMGDPPGVHYRNVWSGNAGFSHRFGDGTSAGLMYDYRQSVYSTSPAASEITPFVAVKFGGSYKLQWYGTLGLSESSADRGMGLVLQRQF